MLKILYEDVEQAELSEGSDDSLTIRTTTP
jgi:hypothetical protein